MDEAKWFDLGEGEGVLELPATIAGRALELHVVLDAERGSAIAWWEDETGAWLSAVDAGLA